ncbi:MAG: methyltransferase domain-containing protein [Proteobacteria bacterium]|nr:methyltransferase domain-containing protein [Pseudomonadota bacterium]
MDKENDTMATGSSSYEMDAEDLLNSLDDDDDDDEYIPEASTSAEHCSIVNFLNASASPDTLNNTQSIQSSPQSAPASSESSEAKLSSASDFSPLGDSETRVAAPQPKTSSSFSISSKLNAVPTASSDVIKPVASAVAPDSIDPNAPKTSIKPFETKLFEKPAPATTPSADTTEKEKSDKPEPAVPAKDEKPTAPSVEPVKPQERRSAVPTPPPAPTPTPSAASITPSSPANGRVLRDGEIVMTQEMLNELLPGGKNDAARDLAAFKFNDNNWYTQVFNDDFLRTVPKSSPRQTQREAKFIMEHLDLERGARVLDLCCGYGRHTILLAAKGYEIVGLDLSMSMLKKALADAQAHGRAIKFVHGDMRKLSFKGIFDAIYNVQTSFGYFDDQSNFKVLQGIFNALKPGGVFLIETINRDFIINDLPLRLWWKGNQCTLLEEIDFESSTGLLKVSRSFVFDDNSRAPWEQKIQIRLYAANEMKALLTRAGFKVVELSGDYSLPGAHFGASSPRNIFVAEKPIK